MPNLLILMIPLGNYNQITLFHFYLYLTNLQGMGNFDILEQIKLTDTWTIYTR